MSYIFLFVSMVVSNASMVSGPVREDWVRRYHGPGYGDDYATAMTVDSEGNVYVTGGSFGRPNYHEYTTLKYDRDGNELWSARYHSSYGHVGDDPAAIAVDAMGNVYVTGTICVQALFKGSCTTSAYGTIKYNPQGGLLWAAEYHWPTAGNDFALAIAVDSEGNAFVTGRCCQLPFSHPNFGSDYATVKYDTRGRQMWAVRYHGPSRSLDGAYAIALDAQGNVYVTGGSGDDSERNHATIKYDADGNEIWVARYPGRGGTALALDVEGNIYVTGVTLYPSYDYLTVKYDSEGTEVWVARHDGERGGARDLAVDSAGNVYSAGAIADDYGTVKYDSKGNEVWVARYHGPGSCCDAVARIAIDGQDNVYVTGRSAGVGRRSDYATIKYDPQGNEVWVARYGGPVDGSDAPWALALDAKGNVYVTGRSYGTATYDAEFATIKYSQQD